MKQFQKRVGLFLSGLSIGLFMLWVGKSLELINLHSEINHLASALSCGIIGMLILFFSNWGKEK